MIARVKSKRLRPAITLREALDDPALLGDVLAGESWKAWRVLLIASMGEALTDDERVLFTALTGRAREPLQRVEEMAGIIGRRGGKSRAISTLACYIAALVDHSSLLVPGETGLLLCIAPDQQQSDITLGYITAAFETSPVLAQLIKSRTQRSLHLKNGITIEVRASDFRRLRGPTYIAVIADECAFWFAENSSNPDSEILNAVRPGLATTRGPLFMISSPYARRGELWRTYQKHFGPSGDPAIMVAQAPSRTTNPSLPQSVVDRATERDPASAAAEYGAQFRTDIESFVSIEVVNACITRGCFERAPQPGLSYSAFIDPSGGSQDSMTMAIGRVDFARSMVVIDLVREVRPPFSPESVTEDFCRALKAYNINVVSGDRYAGEWPREVFSKFGVTYEASAAPKSDLYRDLLPLLNSGRIELLDHPKLVSQLCGLERRTARGGKDSIDHSPGSHDDVANAVAGLAAISNRYGGFDASFAWVGDTEGEDIAGQARQQRQQRIQAIMGGSLSANESDEQAHPTLSNADLRRIASPGGLGG